MPALDPFSASSRPMLAFDTLPKQPLQFAATLHAIDQNAPRLPKPKRDDHQKSYPVPAYTHARTSSSSSVTEVKVDRSVERFPVVGTDEWMSAEVARCVDRADGSLDLKNCGLIRVSPRIADLRDLVTLPQFYSPGISSSQRHPTSPLPRCNLGKDSPANSRDKLSFSDRSFARASSAPAAAGHLGFSSPNPRYPSGLSASSTSPHPRGRIHFESNDLASGPGSTLFNPLSSSTSPTLASKPFSRSKTGAVAFGPPRTQKAKDICIYLGHNSITSLPTAIFKIHNLTLLSLRGNRLSTLPAAISELKNLRELNISNNFITVLPSTILDLNLTVFSVNPNPFLEFAAEEIDHPSGRQLSPLIQHASGSVLRLSTLCLNLLISPHPPANLPPLLDLYDWGVDPRSLNHPLSKPKMFHACIPAIPEAHIPRILQALHSAARGRTESRGLSSASSRSSGPFPRFIGADDASDDPYYESCPSPRHLIYDAVSPSIARPSRHLFIDPAETRLEWTDVHGIPRLPIRWQGCSPGCLAFLEEDEEDWDFDDD